MYMDPMSGAGTDQYRGQGEVDPGTMGQMDVGGYSGGYGGGGGGGGGGGYDGDSFDEEQPLLKELGIDMELIKQKVSEYFLIWTPEISGT